MKHDAETTRGLLSAPTFSVEESAKLADTPVDERSDTRVSQRHLDSSPRPEMASPPTRIGHYIIDRVLGEGGMGCVYKAHDPELDRLVALKVVRDRRVSQLRMLREAQAMARLQHTNVVTVHEVGLFEDRLYIAMEYIDGETLSDWLRAAPRSNDEVLSAFLGAGTGLAAAHRVGLVHRDFKPSNVLLGVDEIARILDFGLVRGVTASTDEDTDNPDEAAYSTGFGHGSALAESLTVTGALMGTPAYMSPEQFMGIEADARSDQFSFCVALYEALYGQHPFQGSTVDELREALLHDRRRARPAGTRVPRWLSSVLERGLEKDRERRWESMDELLAHLRADPHRRRQRALGLVLTLVAVGSAGYAAAKGLSHEACTGVDRVLAEVWNNEARESLHEVFAGAARAYEREQGPAIIDSLDQYASSWISAREATCRDHHQSVLSEARYNGATRCLARRRDALNAVVTTLRDGQGIGEALTMIERLPSIPDCADPTRLDLRYPAPHDPALLDQITALQQRLAGLVVRAQTSNYQSALTELGEIGVEIEGTGYEPLLLEYHLALLEAPGRVDSDRVDPDLPRRTLALALESSDDEAAVAAIAALNNYRELSPAAIDAQASMTRLLGEALLDRSNLRHRMVAASYYSAQTIAEFFRGRLDTALEYAEKSVTIVERAEDASWTDRVGIWTVAAELHQLNYNFERADELIEAVIELRDPSLARHPIFANVYKLQGQSYAHRGEREAALERYDLVIEIHRDAGNTLQARMTIRDRAVSRERLGDAEGALADLQALTEHFSNPAEDPRTYIMTHNGIAVILDRLGRHREAIQRLEHVLVQEVLPADHEDILVLRLSLADALFHAGEYEAAKSAYRDVSRHYEASGQRHSFVSYPIAGLGNVALAERRWEDARGLLEDALAQRLELGDDPELIGETRFALARALRPPGEPVSHATAQRVHALSVAALADFTTAGPQFSSARAEVERWLETTTQATRAQDDGTTETTPIGDGLAVSDDGERR